MHPLFGAVGTDYSHVTLCNFVILLAQSLRKPGKHPLLNTNRPELTLAHPD